MQGQANTLHAGGSIYHVADIGSYKYAGAPQWKASEREQRRKRYVMSRNARSSKEVAQCGGPAERWCVVAGAKG